MKNDTLMGPWVRRFLLEHLVAERNLSRTQRPRNRSDDG
jgi:integrase/recombinase XerD